MSGALTDLEQLVGLGYDVVMGTRKAPETSGVFVALEHTDLPEAQEFYAITLLDAIRQARFWAAKRAQGPAPVLGEAQPGGGE